MPVHWEELPDVSGPLHWHIGNAAAHLAARAADPWAELGACKQSLAAPLKAL